MNRSPEDVARAHIDAVESGDVGAMAADYAVDAVLRRGDDTFTGRDEVVACFATVPERLGEARVVFDSLRVDPDEAVFDCHLEPSPLSVSGSDVCRIVNGFIVHQVRLRSSDF